MPIQGHNFIAGQAQRGSGRAFTAINPASGLPLDPQFNEAVEPDVDAALTAAVEAFKTCRALGGEQSAAFLEAIGEGIIALGDALIRRASEETGLGHDRLLGERARTVNQLKLFAGVAREGSWVDARVDRADPDRKPLPKPDLRRMLTPLGPVAIFGSSIGALKAERQRLGQILTDRSGLRPSPRLLLRIAAHGSRRACSAYAPMTARKRSP